MSFDLKKTTFGFEVGRTIVDRETKETGDSAKKNKENDRHLPLSVPRQCVALGPSLRDDQLTKLIGSRWCEASVVRPVSAAVAGKERCVKIQNDDDDDDDDDDGPLSALGGVLAVDVAVNLLDVAPQPTL